MITVIRLLYALDIAYKSLLYVAQESDRILGLIDIFSRGVHRAAVVDSRMRIKGIVSANSILRRLLREGDEPVSKLLNYTVEKIYEPALTLPSDVTVSEVISRAADAGMVHFVLVDPEGHVRGLVTEGTIIRRLRPRTLNVKASEIMTSPPIELSPYATIREAIEELTSNNVKRVLLTSPGGIYGYYSAADAVRWIAGKRGGWERSFNELTREGIASVMPRRTVFTVDQNADVSRLIPLMKSGREEFVVVTGSENVVGVITERDLVVRVSRLLGADEYVKLLEDQV